MSIRVVDSGTAPAVAAAIGSTDQLRTLVVQCDPGSPEAIYVGNSSAQTIQLDPGSSITLGVQSLGEVYVKSTGAAGTYNYIGSR